LALTERERGTYFEELILCYLRNEATYRDLYDEVWTYAQWAAQHGLDRRDTGIDLVARTRGTGEIHAIQCKWTPLESGRKNGSVAQNWHRLSARVHGGVRMSRTRERDPCGDA
jgi:predicted helicase